MESFDYSRRPSYSLNTTYDRYRAMMSDPIESPDMHIRRTARFWILDMLESAVAAWTPSGSILFRGETGDRCFLAWYDNGEEEEYFVRGALA